MKKQPDCSDPVTAACKSQLDAGMKALECVVECARRIHEVQLEAAVEAHASAEATRKQLQGARESQDLWRIQSEWLSACLQGSLSYWSAISQAVLESQASIAASLAQPSALLPGAGPITGSPAAPLMQMMDSAYKQWLEATRKALTAPAA